jgi:hypothetical protein
LADETQRLKLSDDQVALMHQVLAAQPSSIRAIAERVGQFEVVSQADADALASALIDEMLGRGSAPGGDLNELGNQLDDVIGIVYRASEDFFRCRSRSGVFPAHWCRRLLLRRALVLHFCEPSQRGGSVVSGPGRPRPLVPHDCRSAESLLFRSVEPQPGSAARALPDEPTQVLRSVRPPRPTSRSPGR